MNDSESAINKSVRKAIAAGRKQLQLTFTRCLHPLTEDNTFAGHLRRPAQSKMQ